MISTYHVITSTMITIMIIIKSDSVHVNNYI